MKAKINYKSKKTIIIAVVIIALIILSGLAVGLFLKGNDNAEALGSNTTGNTINNNNENTTSNNQTGNTVNNNENSGNATDSQDIDNIQNEGNVNKNENQVNAEDENKQENVNNENAGNANNQGNADNENANNANNNQNANVPNQEYVSERVEIIPERVISETYAVSWEPTALDTLIDGEISLDKANIVAEKTVAKLTENGFVTNPESVKVGEILKYTIILKNTNTKINGLVNVTDAIPTGTEFVSATETNLKTTPVQYENAREVTSLSWKNVKVEAGSEVALVVYVKVVAKAEVESTTTIDTTSVQNIAKIYDGTTTEEEIPSPETKVANITSNKTSTIIYNEEKPHEHTIIDGVHPLHEQDIIEYTITLTNVGEADGTVEVSDTVPAGTTLIKDGVVTVVDKNGTTTHEMSELVEGIDVTVSAANESISGVATVTFRVIVNSFEEETKVIKNDMAKVDETPTNTTEDEAQKALIDIEATKVWSDDNNKAGVRPESIEFVLVQDGVETSTKLTANAENNWKVNFTNLNKYTAEGKEIVYTVKEVAVNHYNTTYSEDGLTVTNTIDYTSIYTSKEATKVWSDDNNKAGVRPESIEFVLVQDGVETLNKLTANEANEWKVNFINLNKYTANGTEIKYTVKEVAVDHYNTTYSEDGLTVTNTIDYTSIYTSKEATKVWSDDNNKAGVRPENIEFVLVQDGVETSTKLTANAENNWKVNFTNLNKYTAEGKEIVYTVKEVAVDHYNTTYSEDGLTVTNTIDYTSIYTSKEATKVWSDDNNKAGVRPENIEFVLVQDGVETSTKLTANAENNWKVNFTNLNKYTANGTEIKYTVKEIAVDHYNTTYSEDGLTVTNTIDYTSIYTSKEATKVWSDDNNKAGVRPESIEFVLVQDGVETSTKLTANAENNWKVNFTNLNKYTAEGKEIVYTVKEVAVNHYNTTYSEDGLTVTNTIDYTSIYTSKEATKVWSDDNDKAGVRPESIEFVLVQDGVETLNKLTANEANEWKVNFTNLNKYTAEGKEIVYTVKEVAVDHYNTTYSEDGLTVTNTIDYTSIYTSKEATKVWSDDNDKAGVRPENIEFVLVQDGVETSTKLTANAENNWKVNFTNLNKYTAEGKEIVYTVKEVAVNHYNTTYSEDGLTVTNTIDYTSIYTSKEATKVWSDDNDKAGVRPENIEFVLVQDGVETSTKLTANEASEWKVTFTNLNKYTANGTEIKYTVKEIAVDHYNTTYSEDGLTVTNTIDYTSIYTSKTIKKVWDDHNNQVSVRPTSLVLTLNGVDYELTAENDEDKATTNEWTLTIDNLQKYNADGSEIVYEVKENTVPSKYTKTLEQGLIVTNTIDPDELITEQAGTITVKVTSTSTETVSTPMDVVFVIDTSGSMDGENAEKMVEAVNNSIQTVMSKNSDNRIGIAVYSGDSEVLVPLAKYSTQGDYLTLNADQDKITENVTGTSKDRDIEGGTFTQLGIKEGANMLTADGLNRTFTITTNEGKTVTGTRTPVLILITDGDPTYYSASEDVTGTVNGDGNDLWIDQYHYYWTIRTARYYKNQITSKYYTGTDKQAKMFTIGIGIGDTGDYLAKAMLNPDKTNVDPCNDGTAIEIQEVEIPFVGTVPMEVDLRSTKKKLYDLLNTPETEGGAANPYKYSYADASKSGALTESDIENFLTSSLESSTESMIIRNITEQETTVRKIYLTNIDTSKEFLLQIIAADGTIIKEFSSLEEAQKVENGAYVKIEGSTYYVDLSNIEKTATINIIYSELEQTTT